MEYMNKQINTTIFIILCISITFCSYTHCTANMLSKRYYYIRLVCQKRAAAFYVLHGWLHIGGVWKLTQHIKLLVHGHVIPAPA